MLAANPSKHHCHDNFERGTDDCSEFACEKLNNTSLRCVGPRAGTKRSLVNKENVCFLFLLFFSTPFAYPFEESPPRGKESHSPLLSVPRDKLVRQLSSRTNRAFGSYVIASRTSLSLEDRRRKPTVNSISATRLVDVLEKSMVRLILAIRVFSRFSVILALLKNM